MYTLRIAGKKRHITVEDNEDSSDGGETVKARRGYKPAAKKRKQRVQSSEEGKDEEGHDEETAGSEKQGLKNKAVRGKKGG